MAQKDTRSFGKKLADWFFGRLPENIVSVGGQAVMEGVMMQGPKFTALAVRQPDGKIIVKKRPTNKLSDKYPILKLPLIRGVVSFISSLVVGMKTLTESAELAGEQPEEPSAFEKKLAKIFHAKPDDIMIAVALILAIALSILLFFAIPTGIESYCKRFISSKLLLNLVGGIVRITVFLLYVYLCSRLKEIRRVFQYHGAEHKSIFTFEAGEDLTVENARKFTTLHPRCGTSFLVIVMVISIIVFLFLGSNSSNIFARLGSRLALLPLVAGISYEVLKGLAYAEDNRLVKILKWPGLMVQHITTAEPDDSMLEVGLVSLKAALGYENPLEGTSSDPNLETSTAESAASTADTASDTADTTASTADAASDTADTTASTADTASDTADTTASTADTASDTADEDVNSSAETASDASATDADAQ